MNSENNERQDKGICKEKCTYSRSASGGACWSPQFDFDVKEEVEDEEQDENSKINNLEVEDESDSTD